MYLTYGILKERLFKSTIAILDAGEDLSQYIEDAGSGDSENFRSPKGACYAALSIMFHFYTSRLGIDEYGDLPDTAARHILVGGDASFIDSPRIDCVGDVVGGVLRELYDLLDNEHLEKKVEFTSQLIDSQKK